MGPRVSYAKYGEKGLSFQNKGGIGHRRTFILDESAATRSPGDHRTVNHGSESPRKGGR